MFILADRVFSQVFEVGVGCLIIIVEYYSISMIRRGKVLEIL